MQKIRGRFTTPQSQLKELGGGGKRIQALRSQQCEHVTLFLTSNLSSFTRFTELTLMAVSTRAGQENSFFKKKTLDLFNRLSRYAFV